MPIAPARPCPTPGCPGFSPCPAHPKETRVTRGTPHSVRLWYLLARWRHPVWGRRAQVLNRDPLCVECRKIGRVTEAEHIDHVIPHEGDPVRFWDLENLQGLCPSCHSLKTQRERTYDHPVRRHV